MNSRLSANQDTNCPICGRPLPNNHMENEHHLKPKSLGGRETIRIHRVCHSKIHSLFTERELLHHYSTVDKLRSHPEMQKFIQWICKKPADYYTSNFKTRSRASRGRRW